MSSLLDNSNYIDGLLLKNCATSKELPSLELRSTERSNGELNIISAFKEIDSGGTTESNTLIATKEGDENEKETPMTKLVSLIVSDAYKKRASDIHLEPFNKKFRVRYRIDGVLQEIESPPNYLQPNIVRRLKIMAKLDISEKRLPQDGRIEFKTQGKTVDIRVSTIPTWHGESIVMRLLDKSTVMMDISSLGLFHDDIKTIDRIINMPDGMFLLTGPTGSGKSTSLYAFLNKINRPTKKIITVEDPVEYHLEGINQIQVNSSINMTFAAALRAIMRQSPNVIMIGEIRDSETAEIAVNASLTGHLLLSTLHTNDAASAISRLTDIGIKPFLVSSALKAVMAQRLVRKICPSCARLSPLTQKDLEILKLNKNSAGEFSFSKGMGCSKCHNSGFKGRLGIIELFILTEELQRMIFRGASSYKIKEVAIKNGMRTLREDGIRKAMAGLTTLQEVIRVS